MAIEMTTLSGGRAKLDADDVNGLAAALRGEVITPQSADYDAARVVWNAMVDKRPGMIVRCRGAADVLHAVRFARQHDLLVAVRGAGHNIAGNAVCDGGMMIDLSGMRSVRVDRDGRRARVEPGTTLGDLDHETQEFGLATPVGINSTTGISGLTLGGGFGWLSRKYGMTIDNLTAADVVTAEGEMVRADAERNSELFWGIRGGGGNFGIVTSFEFELHPVGPEVFAGLIVHPFSEARHVLEFYRDFTGRAPDDLTVWAVLRKAPPLPFLPEDVHGKEVVVIAACHAGEIAAAEKDARELRAFGKPIADVLGPHPYAGFQQAFDPLLTPGMRNYWKSHNFNTLSDGAIEAVLDAAGNLPTPHTEIFIAQVGGAQSRVDPGATAYWHRDAAYVMNVHTRWEKASDDARCIAWAKEFFDATAPHASGGVYVNFMPDDEEDRVGSAYGGNHARLVALKKKVDPTNFFRLNQNIRPA